MEKFCVYCGKPIEENAKFCPFCGKPAAVQEEQPEPAPQPTPAPAEPASAPQKISTPLMVGSVFMAFMPP